MFSELRLQKQAKMKKNPEHFPALIKHICVLSLSFMSVRTLETSFYKFS